jgi:hypothetical protein
MPKRAARRTKGRDVGSVNGTDLNRHGHLLMQVRDELYVESRLGAA